MLDFQLYKIVILKHKQNRMRIYKMWYIDVSKLMNLRQKHG